MNQYQYALRLSKSDLRILTGLLTGHADFSRHFTFMQIRMTQLVPCARRMKKQYSTY